MVEKDQFKRSLDVMGHGIAATAVYVPPAKRQQLRLEQEEKQKQLQEEKAVDGRVEGQQKENKNSTENGATEVNINTENRQHLSANQQRETWQEQRRVINGTVNRLNSGTIKPLIQDLFQKVNLIRLRGPLCKSVLSAAVSSPKYTDVYAAIIAVINSKLPEVGELMVNRAILSFRRYYKQRDKASCQAVCVFLVHMFHQGVVHELIILQLLSVLLDGSKPTDDSVEVAVHVLQTAGQALLESSSAGVRACTERMRSLLHEGFLNHRVEYRVEELLKARKNGFKDFPSIADELDLVERDDQVTFEITLDDEDIQNEDELDFFSFDSDYFKNEEEWTAIRSEVLGEGDSSSSSGSDDSDSDSSDDDSEKEEETSPSGDNSERALTNFSGGDSSKKVAVVQDLTETDLIHLRRTIYLTIMSSATFEECAHKLARINIPVGRELELINMLIECCSQERTFLRYYGLIASRFCLLDDRWKDAFMASFEEQYATIHRLETNKLRNVAKLFAHILHTDAMPWSVLHIIHLNEDETTSSSRIFIKIVIQEMAEAMGIAKLKNRFDATDDECKAWYAGMFPKDNIRNTRYAINFFTSIGLGPLTDDLREFLKNAPKRILAQAQKEAQAKEEENSSDESSSVSSTSSSSISTSSSSTSSSSTSSSSYSSSSSSSSSSSDSSSYSRSRRLRGRSGGRRNSSSGHNRDRRRRDSSDSSSSYGSSYTSESLSRNGRRKESHSESRRQRSSSPPKIIVKETENRDRRSSRKSSSSLSRRSLENRRRNKSDERSRSHSSRPLRSRKEDSPKRTRDEIDQKKS